MDALFLFGQVGTDGFLRDCGQREVFLFVAANQFLLQTQRCVGQLNDGRVESRLPIFDHTQDAHVVLVDGPRGDAVGFDARCFQQYAVREENIDGAGSRRRRRFGHSPNSAEE